MNRHNQVTVPHTALHSLRRDADMTRDELARELGMSVSTVAAHETGRNFVGLAAAGRYAQALARRLGRRADTVLYELAKDEMQRAERNE